MDKVGPVRTVQAQVHMDKVRHVGERVEPAHHEQAEQTFEIIRLYVRRKIKIIA